MFISITVAVLSGIAVWFLSMLTLDKEKCDKAKVFDLLSSGTEYESSNVGKTARIILSAIVAALSCAAVFRVMTTVTEPINIVRVIVVLFPVIAAGWIDMREKRIPNTLSLFLLIVGIVFLGLILFLKREEFKSYAISCIGSAVVSFLILGGVGMIFRMGIGAGDIKLIAMIALSCGANAMFETVLFGTFICALVAIYLLLFKKKNLKSTLPYGPFIMIGYLITLIICKF